MPQVEAVTGRSPRSRSTTGPRRQLTCCPFSSSGDPASLVGLRLSHRPHPSLAWPHRQQRPTRVLHHRFAAPPPKCQQHRRKGLSLAAPSTELLVCLPCLLDCLPDPASAPYFHQLAVWPPGTNRTAPHATVRRATSRGVGLYLNLEMGWMVGKLARFATLWKSV